MEKTLLQSHIDQLPSFPQTFLEHLSSPDWRAVNCWIDSIPEKDLLILSDQTFESLRLYMLEIN